MLRAKIEPEEVELYTDEEVREALVAFVMGHGSQKDAAADLGISPQYLTDILYRRRVMSQAVASRLGFTLSVWTWRKKP